ncbi:hypothetical protein BHE74_00025545 [Ensete ventricosum]|nr:hypothetical protein BHE74_00025545 [Ensete ventricosum]
MKHRSRELLLSKFYFFIRNAIFGRRTPPLPTCPPPSQTNRQKEHLPRNSWRCGQQRTSRSCHIPVKNPPTPFLTRMLLPPLPPLSFPYILGRSGQVRSGQSSSSCRLNPPPHQRNKSPGDGSFLDFPHLPQLPRRSMDFVSSYQLVFFVVFIMQADAHASVSTVSSESKQTLFLFLAMVFLMLLACRYASVCAIESPSKLDDEQWLAYWILYSFLTLTEMVAEPILAW